MKHISIIVPCYNEKAALPHFFAAILEIALQMPELVFELIFIDDGSIDGTLDLLRQYHLQDSRVHYLSFSRNFARKPPYMQDF